MLIQLHIENIAVIQESSMTFGPGFNALTGETGAGKSIVVDAIGAILGQRTSRDLIRTGAKTACVEGLFQALPALPWFEENGIAPDENGELLNIHGQHDGQQLLDPDCHLSYLDRFGALSEGALAQFQRSYQEVMSLRREIAGLRMDEAERARRVDSLNYQIDELERADLKVGEDEALSKRRDLLRNAEKLMDAVLTAHGALSGDEDSAGAADLLERAENALVSGGRISDQLSMLGNKAAELRYALQDLAEEVRDMEGSLEVEPGELDMVEERLDLLNRLEKKYGSSIEEMLMYLERCQQELNQIEDSDDALVKLEQKLEKALETARCNGESLHIERQNAARDLERRIQTELSEMDMPKVQFQVSMAPKGGELGMDETGMDEVCFLMSANVGRMFWRKTTMFLP